MLQTDQSFPRISSQVSGGRRQPRHLGRHLLRPKAPPGKESNWVPTVPGKGWFVVLRLYGPLNAWFDKKWKPGEVGGDEVTCGWDEAGSHDRSAAISLIRFF